MKRFAALLGLALTALLVTAAPAFADSFTIRKVDTTKFPKVVITALHTGRAPAVSDFHVRENGRLINRFNVVPLGKSTTAIGTVLVVDTSGSMAENGKIDAAKSAAHKFVARKLPNDRMAVVASNDTPRVIADLTTDAAALNKAIDGLAARGGTALWDGVRAGLDLFETRPELQSNLVVLSDGKDTVSKTSSTTAQSVALSRHAAVFAIALKGGDFDPAPLQALAQATGGEMLTATDPRALDALYTNVQKTLQGQHEISYTSTAAGAAIDLDVSAGSLRATATVNRGDVAQGLSVRPEKVSGRPSFIHGTFGRLLIAMLVIAAVGLAVYSLLPLVVRRRSRIQQALALYDVAGASPEENEEDQGFATLPLMRRAVEATAKFADHRGVLERVEHLLEQADVPLRAPEALLFGGLGVILLAAVAGFMAGVIPALLILVLGGVLPPLALQFKAGAQRRKFMSQLPDTLQLLAGSLRAGYSLLQGVEAVSQEVDGPMARELRRILAEARLGRSLEDALDDAAARMNSEDFDWVVMAVRIQREVGGNLAELLSTVNETMVARERLRREVRALTAEGRISAIVLGILPVGIGLALWAINPDYMRVLFTDPVGKAMLAGSVVVGVFGFWWMKKMITIEA